MKLKLKKEMRLAEIFQSLEIKFAFVNKKMEQVSLPAKCRDFLGDCIWSKEKKESVLIYSFSYDYATDPYDTKTLRLSLAFPDNESQEFFIKNLPSFNEKELSFGLTPTSVIIPENTKNTIVIETDKVWQQAPWKIALYTFYLKVLSYESIKKLQNPENNYQKALTKNKEDLPWNKLSIPTKYVAPDIYLQHNNTGFFSLLSGSAVPALLTEVIGDTL